MASHRIQKSLRSKIKPLVPFGPDQSKPRLFHGMKSVSSRLLENIAAVRAKINSTQSPLTSISPSSYITLSLKTTVFASRRFDKVCSGGWLVRMKRLAQPGLI